MDRIVEVEVVVNCRNRVDLSGIVTELKSFQNEKMKKQLDFQMGCVSMSKIQEDNKAQIYPMYIKVSLYDHLAERWESRLRNGDFVEVEGKLRWNAGIRSFKIVAVHLEPGENIKKVIKIKQHTEE